MLMSVTIPTTNNNLCLQCQKIPIKALLFPKTWKDLQFQMRMHELEKTRANRATCGFCRLLLAALSSDPGVEDVTWQRSAFVHFEPSPFGTVAVGDQVRLVARFTVQLIIDTQTWSSNRNGTIFAHGIQVAANVDRADSLAEVEMYATMNHDNLLKGRQLQMLDHVDPELPKSWLKLCEAKHGSVCQPRSFLKPEVRLSFRCIDVRARCIRQVDFSTTRFVALSYVWGDAHQVKLGEDTAARLFEAGGLSDECLDIPQTIRDAMLLTAGLGERFLWVDALCIRQDHDEDRGEHIANMGKVYSGAILTIAVSH